MVVSQQQQHHSQLISQLVLLMVKESQQLTKMVEAVEAVYGFQIDLNTSFTGEDSLDVSIDAGNANSNISIS